MDPIDKTTTFLDKWGRFITAALSTLCWVILFFVFMYWAIKTDRVDAPIPTWLDLLLDFFAYWLPISALLTIACIWICYFKNSRFMFYCNLIPFFTAVILIPIFLLIFTLAVI